MKQFALILAALLASTTPANAADIIWACETTIVSVDVEYEGSSMGGGNEQWIVTYHFERPPMANLPSKLTKMRKALHIGPPS
jgi:hypothetical protein